MKTNFFFMVFAAICLMATASLLGAEPGALEIAFEKARIEMGQQHERQKQQSADHGAVEQNGDDGVIDDGLLLEDVVKAQQDG